MSKKIIKKFGEEEIFDEKKFCDSLMRIGIDEKTSTRICSNIYNKLPNVAKSKDVFRLTLNELKRISHHYALKYNLKKAIFDLGPSGYPFEKYFAKILSEYGYKTITNEIIEGKCLSYEVDIIAIKEFKYIIECKFHNIDDVKSDLKQILYVYGRWIDIKEKFEYLKPWLVTNTKISSEAIKFAKCRNIKITAWRYPQDESLEKLIENKGLYPVTILLSANKSIIKQLINNNYILTNEIYREDIETISQNTGLDKKIIKRILEEIKFLGF
jgi:Holliday junction resolvasome RuvABC DNA-binding subunit